MAGRGPAERDPEGPRPEVLTGRRARAARRRLRRHVLSCALRRKKYPLAFLGPARGGLISTVRLQGKLSRNKVVRFDGRYLFSLNLPLFPSPAFDRMVARGGLNIAASGTPFKKQTDFAILAITRKCHLACEPCYERANLADRETVSAADWRAVVRDLQALGTSIITFSGGEPMLRFEDLLGLVEAGDKNLSDFHIHTSGYGVTRESAGALRRAGLTAAGVGLDDSDPERHDARRGRRGAYRDAVRALGHFREAGVFPYVNACLSADLVRSGRLEVLLRLGRDQGVGLVRWLEPKPSWGEPPERPEDPFSEDDRRLATALYRRADGDAECRGYPPVAYPGYEESPDLLGCLMGGLVHFYIDSLGNVEPCVFLPVSFGNIREESLAPILARMREAVPRPVRRGCPALLLRETLVALAGRGAFPVPYESVRAEWDKMNSTL